MVFYLVSNFNWHYNNKIFDTYFRQSLSLSDNPYQEFLKVKISVAFKYILLDFIIMTFRKEKTVAFIILNHPQNLEMSAGDLLSRTHEELVLLLIQLRRQSSQTARAIEQCCSDIHDVQVDRESIISMFFWWGGLWFWLISGVWLRD